MGQPKEIRMGKTGSIPSPCSARSYGKISSAKLNRENRTRIHPVIHVHSTDTFEMEDGFILLGWSEPIIQSIAPDIHPHAIVYEKIDKTNEKYLEDIEFGICWAHGDADKMIFE